MTTTTATVRVTAATMNPGTPGEFTRVFLTCDNGHDLGSVALESARRRHDNGRPGVEFDAHCGMCPR